MTMKVEFGERSCLEIYTSAPATAEQARSEQHAPKTNSVIIRERFQHSNRLKSKHRKVLLKNKNIVDNTKMSSLK